MPMTWYVQERQQEYGNGVHRDMQWLYNDENISYDMLRQCIARKIILVHMSNVNIIYYEKCREMQTIDLRGFTRKNRTKVHSLTFV